VEITVYILVGNTVLWGRYWSKCVYVCT